MNRLFKSLFLSIIFFLSVYLVISAQPILTVIVNQLDYDGFLLMTPRDYPACVAYDLTGNVVYTYSVEISCHNFHRLDNGDWLYYDLAQERWEQYAAFSDTIKTAYAISNAGDNDPHDIIVKDGYVWLAGKQEHLAISGTLAFTLRGTTIQKQDLSGNVLFHWRSWDHIDTDEATLPIGPNSSYPHLNSMYEDIDGNLIVSFRHTDSVMKICTNGDGCESGEIIWRLGGTKSDFAFANNDRGIAKQHSALMTNRCHSGVSRCLLLFDNGNDFEPAYSRAAEYVLDESAGLVTKTWEYTAGGQILAQATGNVKRLVNGDTVIGWGTARRDDPSAPTVTVVDWDGNVKYEAMLPEGMTSYRAHLYPIWRVMYLPLVAR